MTDHITQLRQVDQSGIKTGMATTIVLLVLGFIFDFWPLVALVAAAQLLGALALPFAPYRLFYRTVIKPSGLIQPNVIQDNPEPHRFAMLVGGLFDVVALLALLAGGPLLAWILVGIVVVLANLNLWLGFCMGCWMYYQLNRLGLPGFAHAPVVERQKQ